MLLTGPSGCGKTTLAYSIAGEFNLDMFKIAGPQIISSFSGESESKIRKIFAKIKENNKPAILFLDEIDTIVGKRENSSKEMEARIVSQIKTCIENLDEDYFDSYKQSIEESISIDCKKDEDISQVKSSNINLGNSFLKYPVFIIGATNRPEHIEGSLRRSGVFDLELEIGYPNSEERKAILHKMIQFTNINLNSNIVESLADLTSGYLVCDLKALIKQSGMCAVKRIRGNSYNDYKENISITNTNYNSCSDDEHNKSTYENNTKAIKKSLDNQILYEDFLSALKYIKPNCLREGFTNIPSITWNDIGGLDALKETLYFNIVKPIKDPLTFKSLNINAAGGVLLYGPPGCGKTLLAKAVANASSANFISIKGPELLNKYVGESEKAVRELFKKAKNSQPCVIFFDEFDALAPKRSNDQNAASDRVVTQLLTLMDGVEDRQQVYVIAATNRPDVIDDAMLREGRLGAKIYVPLPDEKDRYEILKTLTRGIMFSSDLKQLSTNEKTKYFTGADLAGLIREAKMNFLKRKSKEIEIIKNESDISKNNKKEVIVDNNYTISKEYKSSLKITETKEDYVIISEEDLNLSLKNYKPSVSIKELQNYNELKKIFN